MSKLYVSCSRYTLYCNVLSVFSVFVVNIVTVGMSMDGYQTLSSDGATLAMQQVMMGNHSEDETDNSEDEGDTHLSSASMTDLGLNASN